ncbi:MAG TPA: hypothetical protein VJO12_01825 [Stellaceae bacterium]|nr:hypothetical protein [Stellaceae bacterium]
MTQGLLQLATTGTVSGLQNNQAANTALAALAGMIQGASAPTAATTGLASMAGVWWHDTANKLLKVRDQADANWIVVAQFDETNALWIPVFNGQALAAALAGMQAVVNPTGSGWTMAGPLHGLKNRFHNGGCQVAQRAAVNLGTSFQYGAVDRFMAAVTAGTVSAGTIAQATSSPAGRTGLALQLSGVTTTGSAVVSAKQRIESRDAVLLKNQNGSISLHVYQDTGGAINYTITLRKPTAADNYASTTTIATSSTITVPNATDTLITFPNQVLGDVSNGLEVQVDAACGAVTTKNFHFTEWQMEEGPAATAFERRPYEQELRDCQRFAEVLTELATEFAYPFSTPSGAASPTISMIAKKRVVPTMSLTGTASLTAGSVGSGTVTFSNVQTWAFMLNCTGNSQGFIAINLTPGTGGILISADL